MAVFFLIFFYVSAIIVGGELVLSESRAKENSLIPAPLRDLGITAASDHVFGTGLNLICLSPRCHAPRSTVSLMDSSWMSHERKATRPALPNQSPPVPVCHRVRLDEIAAAAPASTPSPIPSAKIIWKHSFVRHAIKIMRTLVWERERDAICTIFCFARIVSAANAAEI